MCLGLSNSNLVGPTGLSKIMKEITFLVIFLKTELLKINGLCKLGLTLNLDSRILVFISVIY